MFNFQVIFQRFSCCDCFGRPLSKIDKKTFINKRMIIPMNIALILNVSTNIPPIRGPNAFPQLMQNLLHPDIDLAYLVALNWQSLVLAGHTNISPKVRIIIPIKKTVNCSAKLVTKNDNIKLKYQQTFDILSFLLTNE